MKKIVIFFLVTIFSFPSVVLAEEEKKLVICSWGGSLEKAQREAFFGPFEKATGIKVIAVAPPTAAKVKAMVESGNVEWDIVCAAGGIFTPLLKQGLVAKIDYKYFDKKTLDELYPDAKQPYAVGTFYFSIVLAYSTETYSKKNHPKTWAEFWDVKKFPGPRTLLDMSVDGSGWEFALIADGVRMDKLYDNPDLDRAFRKLKEIKPHVVKWWKQGQESGQMLIDKEIVLGSAYNGRIQQLAEQGAPVDIDYNQGKLYLEYLFIPRGAKHYDNALKFMAFHCQADRQAALSNIFPYGPVNKRSFNMLSPQRAQMMPSYPANKNKQFSINEDWFMDNTEKVIERWNKWILEK